MLASRTKTPALPQVAHGGERQDDFTAEDESSEGVVAMLQQMSLEKVLWPHSALSRRIIADYLGPKCHEWVLYDTVNVFDEVIVTSPSTVDALLKHIVPIGNITKEYLQEQKEAGCQDPASPAG